MNSLRNVQKSGIENDCVAMIYCDNKVGFQLGQPF